MSRWALHTCVEDLFSKESLEELGETEGDRISLAIFLPWSSGLGLLQHFYNRFFRGVYSLKVLLQ